MSTLYITQQDSVLRKVDERLKVTQNGQTLLDIPLIKVSQVILYGRVTVTPATVATLMEHGVGLCYLSEQGRYIGRLEPHFSKNSLLRVHQCCACISGGPPSTTIASSLSPGSLSRGSWKICG